MDWLTRLPVVGPIAAWVLRTRAYQVYEHFGEVGSNRMAGSVTFYGFLALFPLATVAAAAAAAALSQAQVDDLKQRITAQLPAMAELLDLDALVRNAGTVGLVSAVLLLASGLGWVDTLRACVRVSWSLPPEPGNPVLRKLADVGVLIGLGLVVLVSLAASALAGALTDRVVSWIGLDHSTAGRWLLAVAGYVVAVGADMLLFGYLLVGLPRIAIAERDKRAVLEGALLGAVGFEVLKQVLSLYIARVAGRSLYGAFGTPVAVLLWINFMFRWLFFCVAWTATADPAAAEARARARAAEAWHRFESPSTPYPAPRVEPGRPRWPALLAAFLAGVALGRLRARRRAVAARGPEQAEPDSGQ
ncbi:YihY/virulence factor BrkB family protein [Streptacidiphilus monticola]